LAGLSSGGLPLDGDDIEPFRGGIHRSREARRSRSDDHQVVRLQLGTGAKMHGLRQRSEARIDQACPILEQDDWEITGRHSGRRKECRPFGTAGVDSLIRNLVPREEVFDVVGRGVEAVSQNSDP
jgi:hypothetical protein